MKIVHQNLLLPLGSNVVEDSENEESQQGVNGPPDCILAVSDDSVQETDIVSTDPKSMGKGDVIWVQCIQTVFNLN